MAIKKSELYTSLWKSCDELRGGMDASQYKDYVLVLLFVKYVSDKAASQKNYLLDVPKGGSFPDMVALQGDTQALAFGAPLLVMDMYEHAYQMDYGAQAAKYIDAFFQNVAWDEVNRRLDRAERAMAALRK